MTIFYLYDTGDNSCKGIHEGDAVPSGTADAGVAPSDGRMEWAGGVGPWTLPTAAKAADERDWRDSELAATDLFGLSDQTMTAGMTTYRQELRDMPVLTGFPDTHTRPTLA